MANFNGVLPKPPLKTRHGWILTFHVLKPDDIAGETALHRDQGGVIIQKTLPANTLHTANDNVIKYIFRVTGTL